jgi:Caudovirus prohead serine protease
VRTTALEMKMRLANLAERHRVKQTAIRVPLTEPTDHPMCLSGYASTSDIDLQRTKFRAYCFGYPLTLRAMPPLYLKHDSASPAGLVEKLSYDAKGLLLIEAQVTHELARRCGAFSISARVLDYEIKDADSASYHALVTSAEICEVSLTDVPANPNALVKNRVPQFAGGDFYSLMIQKMNCLTRMTNLLTEMRP